jgi:hypothetical protein
MWGNGLPDIWCNQGSSPTLAFMVNAIMAVVRDEAQWLDSLGIIGAGPIYAYTIAPGYSGEFVTNADGYTYFLGPNVDGFPAQGWKGNSSGTGGTNIQPSGLRQVLGADPANASDTFGLTGVGGAEPGATYAAGTAFVELRYPKSGSVTPSVPESHTMQVPIAQGLTGWVWDVNGNRTAAPGLTNPFWIAVNTYLRALGLFNANSSTQLQSWPTATGLTGYSLFVSSSDDLICYVQSGTLASGSGGYTPASITCIGPLPRSTWALPNSNVAKVRLKGKPLIHGGVEGAAVNSLTTTTITANECIDIAATDNWAGRVIAIIGRNNSSAPYVSFNCTAFQSGDWSIHG